jgi:hypothetical protein
VRFVYKCYSIFAYVMLLTDLGGRIFSLVSVLGSLGCVRVPWIKFPLLCGRPSWLLYECSCSCLCGYQGLVQPKHVVNLNIYKKAK